MNLTPIVATCDSYLDLLPNFIELYYRYSELQPPLIVGETQTLKNIEVLTSGEKQWGQRIIKALDTVDSSYIFLALDDYYLQTPITAYIHKSIELLEADRDLSKISFISNKHFRNYKLIPTDVDDFYMMHNSCRWLATLQIGIWRTEVLRGALKPDYSPWDFEMKAREFLINSKCAVLDPQCELVFNFVRKGKQLSKGWQEFLNKENLTYIHS